MSFAKSIWKRLRAFAMRTMPFMLACREIDDLMADYLEGELPEGQRRKFERHMRLCRDCRRYLKSYETTIRLTKASFEHADSAAPEEIPEELVQAILKARRDEP